MIGELLGLCQPFADMYVFQVANQLIMPNDDQGSSSFLLVSVLILALSLFLSGEARSADDVKARLVFFGVVVAIALAAHWRNQQHSLGAPPPPAKTAAKPRP